MKICAIICEFNPFHNGHARIISEAKRLSGCDFTVCLMSGQFTQRGDVCRVDKFLRARHALCAGADAVIELPAPFAVAPAEIFAKGAIKLLCGIEGDITLCFGSESGDGDGFLNAAATLSRESSAFKKLLSDGLGAGLSYVRSYAAAFEALGGDPALISSPNNILGVEYCKAALLRKKPLRIMTVPRLGGENFLSAHGIRDLAENGGEFKAFMPDYAYGDFNRAASCKARFEQACADGVFFCDAERLKRVYGCTEGLENRLKKLTRQYCGSYADIIENATSKRYSSTRIKRIMTANLLGLYADDTERFLNAELPLKALAVKKACADALLPALSRSAAQSGEAEACYKLNSDAYALWRYLTSAPPLNPNEKMILVR